MALYFAVQGQVPCLKASAAPGSLTPRGAIGDAGIALAGGGARRGRD
jgi:hypothetical protein